MPQDIRIAEVLELLRSELEELTQEVGAHESRASSARARQTQVKNAIAALEKSTPKATPKTLTVEEVADLVRNAVHASPAGVRLEELRRLLKKQAQESGRSGRGSHRVLSRVISELRLEEVDGLVRSIPLDGTDVTNPNQVNS